MVIKRWNGKNENIKKRYSKQSLKNKLNNGGNHMAVSMVNTIPVIRGEDAKRINEEIKKGVDKDFFDKCAELSKKLRSGYINR